MSERASERETLAAARARLRKTLGAFPNADLDADLLLCEALSCAREQLYARPETRIDERQAALLDELLARRARGEPMAYLLRVKEFYSLEFEVTPATLIPRPATETLVDAALSDIARRAPSPTGISILELGVGCGAVAIALSATLQRHRIAHRICTTDISQDALAVAKRNAHRHRARAIEFIQCNWFECLRGRAFDLIVSNPPYIAENDSELAAEVKEFEPREALIAGARGDECLARIIAAAAPHLNAGGSLILEHGARQAERVAELLRDHGYTVRDCLRDAEKHPRVCVASARDRKA